MVGGWIPRARPAKRVLRLACGVQGNQPPAVSVLREQTSLSAFPEQSGKDDDTSPTMKVTFGGCLPMARRAERVLRLAHPALAVRPKPSPPYSPWCCPGVPVLAALFSSCLAQSTASLNRTVANLVDLIPPFPSVVIRE